MLDKLVKEFKPEHHPELASWFVRRKLPIPPTWLLSDTGYIIHGRAAGFLYLTNSSVGRIDVLIANPSIPKDERSNAIDAIVRKIISRARDEYGVKLLCCTTKLKSVEKRARLFRFIDTGTFVGFAKEL